MRRTLERVLPASEPVELGMDHPMFTSLYQVSSLEGSRSKGAPQALRGIERTVWIQVEGHAPVVAIADEDLERENDTKTSSVHFLRFELSEAMAAALKGGAALGMGINHPAYTIALDEIAPETQLALVSDLK